MDQEYQNEQIIKDLYVKEQRLIIIEKKLKEVLDLLDKSKLKLRIALEGLSHIDNPIARQTEEEIDEIE